MRPALKIKYALPFPAAACAGRASGAWRGGGAEGEKGDKGRWRGRKKTPMVVVAVITWASTWMRVGCARGVRDQVEGRDLRGRADE